MNRKIRFTSVLMAKAAVYKVSQRNEYMYDGGPLEQSTTYEYDKNGNVIKEVNIIYPDEGLADPGSKSVIYYTYEEGRLTRATLYHLEDDGSEVNPSTVTYQYNEDSQLILEESVGSTWSERSKKEYSNGKLVRQVDSTYENGVLLNQWIYRYSYGKNTETIRTYDKNHNPDVKDISVFDKNGNEIQGKSYKYKSGKWVFLGSQKRAYDKNNRLIRYEDYGADGKIQKKETHTYNKYGDCVKIVYYTYRKSGKYRKEVVRATYKYDSHGNMVKSKVENGGMTTYAYVKI